MEGKDEQELVQNRASPGGFLECLLTWEDLKYSIVTTRMCALGAKRKSEKVILENVRGYCAPGELTAVIGASGAGKTTLLNLLAMRTRTGKIEGDILVNGEKVSKQTFRHLSGYVLQHDALLPFLTVEETLFYAAMLSLPKRLSFVQKMERVKEVLTELQLNHCRTTIVGSELVRGVSGGERKRVSIGIELLRNPAVLFADEPTSGLDAKIALDICRLLAKLAHDRGHTVIMCVHQPRAQIVALIDRLIIMAPGGRQVYFGPQENTLAYFSKLGFDCPMHENPADYYLDVTSRDNSSEEATEESEKRLEQFRQEFQNSTPEETPPAPENVVLKNAERGANWLMQVVWVTHRSMLNTSRNTQFLFVRIGQTVFTSVLLGLLFFQLDNDQTSINDRAGLLFFNLLNVSFNELYGVLGVFPIDRVVFLRERDSGDYRVSSYYIGKQLAELPFQLLFPILGGVIIYWMVGLQAVWYKFITFLGIMGLVGMWATSMGFLLSAGTSVVAAGALGPIVTIVSALFGGFFVNEDTIPDWLSWLEWLSYTKYAFSGLIYNEFTGLELTCDSDELIETDGPYSQEICPVTDGDEVVENLGADDLEPYQDMLILCLFVLVLRLLTYVVLVKVRPTRGVA